MFGGYGNIVKSDYKKPFKIFFESPLFHDTVVEILFAFDIERSPLILLFTSLSAIKPFSLSLRQNSEIHIRLYSLPPSVPRAMLLSISNAKSISINFLF
jgi:hypothetical protein